MAAIIAQGRPGATSGTCPVRLAFLRRTPGGTLSVPQHARTDQGHQDLDAACPRGPRPFHGAPVLEVGRGFFHPVAIPPPCPARGGTALWGSVAYARPGKRLGRSFLGHREGGVGRFRAGESGEGGSEGVSGVTGLENRTLLDCWIGRG